MTKMIPFRNNTYLLNLSMHRQIQHITESIIGVVDSSGNSASDLLITLAATKLNFCMVRIIASVLSHIHYNRGWALQSFRHIYKPDASASHSSTFKWCPFQTAKSLPAMSSEEDCGSKATLNIYLVRKQRFLFIYFSGCLRGNNKLFFIWCSWN